MSFKFGSAMCTLGADALGVTMFGYFTYRLAKYTAKKQYRVSSQDPFEISHDEVTDKSITGASAIITLYCLGGFLMSCHNLLHSPENQTPDRPIEWHHPWIINE